MKKAVGFYWTLPVPWISEPFTQLSPDVEQAAKESLTIRYQREVVRRWAKDNDFEVSKEGVYLELKPDRAGGSWDDFYKGMPPELYELVEYCRNTSAEILYVDFQSFVKQRRHIAMQGIIIESGVNSTPILPEERSIQIDGKLFDPKSHFKEWRDRHAEWRANKPERERIAANIAFSLRAEGITLNDIANILNERSVSTPLGKKWTADNLGTFLTNYRATEG